VAEAELSCDSGNADTVLTSSRARSAQLPYQDEGPRTKAPVCCEIGL